MMIKIHQRTTLVLFILVTLIVAFIGLMVIEWGADYSSASRMEQNIIGKINDREISIDYFRSRVQQAYQNELQRSGKSNLSDEELQRLRDRIWEEIIQEILLAKEVERLNIKVSNEDIANNVLGLLTIQYQNDPNFQTNGQFDVEKLKDALRQDQNKLSLLQLEMEMRQRLPYQKLLEIVNAAVIIPEAEIRDEFKRQNLQAKLDYLFVPVSGFLKDSVKVTEEELRKYYKEHKEKEFARPEKRQLNYALFSLLPTADDSVMIREKAERIKQEALSGKDFAALADLESQDPSVINNHGDLGYFARDAMVPEFSEAAFSAKPGQIIGPVETRHGLHIIKVIDRKVEDGVEKVHAAHILIKFEASSYTRDEAYNTAYALAERAKHSGLKKAADELGVEIKQTSEFPMNRVGQIPGVGRFPQALQWAFDNEEGAVSDVYQSTIGYTVFEVAKVIPEGYRSFEEAKEICQNRVEQQKRKELARALAEKIAPEVKSKGIFKYKAESELNFLTADSTQGFANNIFIPKIGRAPTIAAAAFKLPLNEIAGPLEADRGFYFIRIKQRDEFDEAAYAQQQDELRDKLLQQKSQRQFNEWYSKLKEKAEIVDHRYLFYRS